MESRNTTQENSTTDERDRIREASRALVEEYRRKHDERLMSEATVATYDRIARQTLLTSEGESFFRGGEDNGEEAKEDTGVCPQEIEVPWFPGLCIRLVPSAPYYIN